MGLMFPNNNNPLCSNRIKSNGKALIKDLMLDKLAEKLNLGTKYKLNGERILELFTDDLETIGSRQAISRDLYREDELFDAFLNVYYKMEEFYELNDAYLSSGNKEMRNLFISARWLELYIIIICDLHDTYMKHAHNMESKALLNFGEMVESKYNTEEFKNMKANIANLLKKTIIPKSAKLGVNLSEDLTPKSITCIDLNNDYFQPRKLLGNKTEINGIGKFRYKPARKATVGGFEYIEAGAAPMLARIKKYQAIFFCEVNPQYIDGIDGFMKQLNFNEKSTVKNYIMENAGDIINMIRDIAVFLGGIKLARELRGRNLPVCLPLVTDETGTYENTHLYNILLPFELGKTKPVITNNVIFSDNRLKILTGPNKGGKTTIIQAMGLSVIMAQLGLHVAGDNVAMSTFDSVFTLFQGDEKLNREGRLSHEARLLKKIYDMATPRSFVLLNEIFTSTSPSEGLYLLAEAACILLEIECTGIIVTHYHKLFDKLLELLKEDKKIKEIDFISFGISGHNRERTYKLEDGPGENASYAMDIVKKYAPDFL